MKYEEQVFPLWIFPLHERKTESCQQIIYCKTTDRNCSCES